MRRKTFSYPDFTVGSGFTPDHASIGMLAGLGILPFTAGRELPRSPCPEGISIFYFYGGDYTTGTKHRQLFLILPRIVYKVQAW